MKLGTIGDPRVCLMTIEQKMLQCKDPCKKDKLALKILLSDKINVSTLVSTIRKMRRSAETSKSAGSKAKLERLARLDRHFQLIMPRHLSVQKRDACV